MKSPAEWGPADYVAMGFVVAAAIVIAFKAYYGLP
jgi:hypothetical protein